MLFLEKLFNKSKLYFSLALIGIYIVFSSLFDSLSQKIGIEKLLTVPFLAVFSVGILYWLKKQNLLAEYGICSFKGNKKNYLYFLPLLVLITENLWCGFKLNFDILEAVFYILSMLFVGLLEELIFRGFLFKSLINDGVKKAIIISSVTFGMGHIVNLLNGADFLPTLLQICYAAAIGFLFTIIFYKGKSLIPCIITHGVFNSLSAFAVTPSKTVSIIISVILCVIPISYSFWIIKKCTD